MGGFRVYEVKVHSNGHREWFYNGQRHREDGPAVECGDGNTSYYLNDKFYYEDDFRVEMQRRTSPLELFKQQEKQRKEQQEAILNGHVKTSIQEVQKVFNKNQIPYDWTVKFDYDIFLVVLRNELRKMFCAGFEEGSRDDYFKNVE